MLYRVYVLQKGVAGLIGDVESNSFARVKDYFTSMMEHEDFIGTESVLIMRCSGVEANRFDYSDPETDMEIRPFV